ncbi:hypothetical protein FFLO_01149 [Filobasidium floriforme]|uniref:Carbohydrate kinase PfkB domain-containing protein n=1 Tax=Filobasidium floriforme TaxID=5210 RepID=A0A8K0JQ79_9TREE|nr:Ribokinase-like protein [Filobasidium floriforme]KAG7570951.1 hypothetical protein FFLO_01149 [Filobasidium floriforme]KAH8077458.1 Ribokinase-like protein [Filobasidium floriforme]
MFVIDEFKYLDERGQEDLGRQSSEQIGGAGTYYSVGARIHLPADQVGQVVHLGNVFPFLDNTTSGSSSSTSPPASGSSSGSTALNEDTNSTPTNSTSETPTSDTNIYIDITSKPLKPKQGDNLNTKAKPKAEIEAETEATNPNPKNAADEPTQSTLETYGPEMWEFLQRGDIDGRGTTRALNIFKVGGEARDFRFLTPPIRIYPQDIFDSPRFFSKSKEDRNCRPCSVHFPSAPTRTREILQQIDRIDEELRQGTAGQEDEGWDPELIWEPFPMNCTHREWPEHAALLPRMTVFSPNHVESLALLGKIPSPYTSDEELEGLLGEWGRVDEVLEEVGKELLRVMLEGGSGSTRHRGWERGVVIRCGSKGCLLFTANGIAGLPAYYTESTEDQGQVVDVTGGGNAFLGGLVAGLASRPGMTLVEAACYGSVSASFTIQQAGLPVLTKRDGVEMWNGETSEHRLRAFCKRHGFPVGDPYNAEAQSLWAPR